MKYPSEVHVWACAIPRRAIPFSVTALIAFGNPIQNAAWENPYFASTKTDPGLGLKTSGIAFPFTRPDKSCMQ